MTDSQTNKPATVGELRAILANVPDSQPLAIFSSNADRFITFSIAADDVDDNGVETTVIYAED